MGTCCYGYMTNKGSIFHDEREAKLTNKNNNILFKQLLMTLNRFFRNIMQEAVECTVRKLNKLNKQWKNILFEFCCHENRELQNLKNIGLGL